MAAAQKDTFYGWLAPDDTYKLEWGPYDAKTFTDDDVDLDLEACGVCWSDLSTMSDGWGPAKRPLVVGHELVGKVTRVGKNVKHLKVGDRAGCGAQCDCCHSCKMCDRDLEPYCLKGPVGTYNGKHPDGTNTAGGYATKWRGNGRFAIPIPDDLETHIAGPLLCGGITIYSPLKNYGCGTEGVKKVGIVGVGGIGAFGIAFAKALGADEVVAIGHSPSKKDLAFELGATDFVAMGSSGDKNPLLEKYHKELDLIILTANNADQRYDWYAQSLRPLGHVINIAVPHEAVMPIPIGDLLFSGSNVGGSAIGPPRQIKEMLEFAAKTKPRFMIEKRNLSDANQVVQDMAAGKPRFRYCMINDLAGKEEEFAKQFKSKV